LVDPFGGIVHLDEKLIKTPLNPAETFSDDPLRMMRAIRFASQLNFKISDDAIEAIKNNKDRIRIVSQERVTDELNKIILSPKPSIGFNYLFDTGLLHIIFPANDGFYGVDYIDGKGHKDNFYHTLQVLDNICPVTMTCGCAGPLFCMILPNPPPNALNPATAGRSTATKTGRAYGP
jgi:poly(A) polymerase